MIRPIITAPIPVIDTPTYADALATSLPNLALFLIPANTKSATLDPICVPFSANLGMYSEIFSIPFVSIVFKNSNTLALAFLATSTVFSNIDATFEGVNLSLAKLSALLEVDLIAFIALSL